VRSSYLSAASLPDLLASAAALSVRTIIFDVEPLVAFWRSGQAALDEGVVRVLGQVKAAPTVRSVLFVTNSARRPSRLPEVAGLRVAYLASAGKPLRTAPYLALPRPGAVIGDQVPTDGLLARRLGYTFLLYRPELAGVPLGPTVLHRGGELMLPLLFRHSNQHSERTSPPQSGTSRRPATRDDSG
jgi:predicted HAD superfamily phosphohydrolase YqeG